MRSITAAIATAAIAALAAAPVSFAAKAGPRAETGGVKHVLGASALLTATVNPEGQATSYYFQYGPSIAYGSQTSPVPLGNGTLKIKVGQSISGLKTGVLYHYRVVAVWATGVTAVGRDRTFAPKGSKPRFVLAKRMTAVYGSPTLVTGTLTGVGSANQRVVLQASPFPYLEAFTPIGVPGVTNAAGAFAFRLSNLFTSTQLRVSTMDPLPIFSSPVLLQVTPKITFSAHTIGHLTRLYGTITPALPSARIYFQVETATRPHGPQESTVRWATVLRTSSKHGGRTLSRFSLVAKLPKSGRYRAYVQLPVGALASGAGTHSIVLKAPPARKKKG
jgi:hypothetical protein